MRFYLLPVCFLCELLRLVFGEKQCEKREDGKVFVYHIGDTMDCKTYCGEEVKRSLDMVSAHCLQCCPDLFASSKDPPTSDQQFSEETRPTQVYLALFLVSLSIIVVMTVVIAFLLRDQIRQRLGRCRSGGGPVAGPERDPDSVDEESGTAGRRESSGISMGESMTDVTSPPATSPPANHNSASVTSLNAV